MRSLPDDVLTPLAQEASVYALSHGLLVVPASAGGKPIAVHAPLTLTPAPIPKGGLDFAYSIGTHFNTLVDAMSAKPEYLKQVLTNVIAGDPFTAKLLDILTAVELTPGARKQPIQMGIHRSDYMLHEVEGQEAVFKQVELNTISSSFGALSVRTNNMHRFLISRGYLPGYSPDGIPPNDVVNNVVRSMHVALEAFGVAGAQVLFLVQPGERNAFDQRHLEYALWKNHGVAVIRRTLDDIAARGSLSAGDANLVIDDITVGLVYFRAGYTPDDYHGEEGWKARELIERSSAIKCPSIAYHLAGTKKVQQVLCRPGELEKFVDSDVAAELRKSFVGLYSLDEHDAGTADLVADAKANKMKYVLKPQREGGGNNLYGDDLVKALNTLSPKDLSSYVLMDRLYPHQSPTYILREGQVHGPVQGVSELGIFGVFVGAPGNVIVNEVAGHLLRTKMAHQEDGGVAAGVAVLDSPYIG